MTSASTMAAKKLMARITPPRTEKPRTAVADAPTGPNDLLSTSHLAAKALARPSPNALPRPRAT